jgi:hypothetical protein
MNSVRLLLRAYYERLHERMEAAEDSLTARMGQLLSREIERQGFGPMSPDKLEAYHEACIAFAFERLEMYNPIGIQYTFSGQNRQSAAELEFQLNWYDSRPEFQTLVKAAQALADESTADEDLSELADRLIRQAGAFPDRSIVAAYTEKPSLQKLPDFVVSMAIEQVVCSLIVDDG